MIKDEVYEWDIRVATEKFNLHPVHQNDNMSIDGDDYNITIEQQDGSSVVVLRLMHNENTWEHVPFVFCRLVRKDDLSLYNESEKVFFQPQAPATTVTTEETPTTSQPTQESSTPDPMTEDINQSISTTDSGRSVTPDTLLVCTLLYLVNISCLRMI